MSDKEHLNASLRTIAKGAGIGFVGTAIGLGFGFFTRIVIARFLGPDEYGLISLGFAALNIAVIIGLLGLRTGIVRYVSYYRGKQDDARIKGTIISALKISLPLSIAVACLLFFSATWLSIDIFHEPGLIPILQIFSIAVPFWVLAQIFLPTTVGFQDVKYKVYTEDIFHNLFKLVVISIFLYFGFGVIGATFGWLLSIMAMAVMAFYYLEKKVFPLVNTKIKAISTMSELLFFSIPLIFAAAAGLLLGYTDTLMLGYFYNADEVGVYNAALPTAGLMRVALGSFGVIVMPVVTGLYAQKRCPELRNIYSTVTKWIIAIVFPGFLLILLFAKPIMWILFGSDYVAGATALVILAFGYLVTSVCGTSERIITAAGKTKVTMWCIFFGSTANFLLNLYLIPIYGINGAAIATAMSFILMYTLMLLFTYKLEKMQPFRWNQLKPVIAASMACLLVYGITEYLLVATAFVLVLMFVLFIGLYFVLLLFIKGFDEDDLMIMRAIEEKTGMRWELARRIVGRFL